MKIKFNDENENLYCCYCKAQINIGEKFLQVTEGDEGDTYTKEYHLNKDCTPEMEEE